MSYSQHYSTTVRYSGTVHYTYPASEHGGSGSAHYSGTVPIDIDIDVDTDAFDNSVDGTRHALSGVAGALGAAELAQVEAIRQAGRKVARTATEGFFGVLKSEMSSRMTESSSSMKSCMGLILEQAQAIEGVHRQMDSDYHSIKGRYQRIFDELDSELDRRIKEINRDAFQLSERAMQAVVGAPLVAGTARVYTWMRETSVVPCKLQCASAKSRTSDVLGNMGGACEKLEDYAHLVDMLVDEGVDEAETSYLPVAYAVQSDLVTGEERTVICQNAEGSDAIRGKVELFVATQPQSRWTDCSEMHGGAVEDGFLRRVEHYMGDEASGTIGLDKERVCRLMLDLYRQARIKTAYAE